MGLPPSPSEMLHIHFSNPRESAFIRGKVLALRVVDSQNGKCPVIHRKSCFLTGFSFVLSALAVDTHAAYENESSSSTPTCVSSRPS
jgi:hypothetical protein